MFTDRIYINVQAGHGGNGCDSYYRRTDRKVVPHGGDGGDGGSIIFKAELDAPGLESFRLRQKLVAESGGHGGSTKKRGKNGENLIITVPVGTQLYDRERNFLIRDLMVPGEEVVAVRGGKGGQGNQGGKRALTGERGECLQLELRVLIRTDVFLIGLPNSGKSTLLNKLTRSHAKVDTYPFTTKSPEFGMIPDEIGEGLKMCELPSIYESSHEGRGMGTDFLKHLRGSCRLVFVLDPVSEFAGSLKEGLKVLRRELELYDPEFLKIPYIIAVNKMDLPEAKARVKAEKFRPRVPVFPISALKGEGLDALVKQLKSEKQSV